MTDWNKELQLIRKEEKEEQRIQRLVKEEIDKTKEKSIWRRYKDGCYKLFPYIIGIVVIIYIFEIINAENSYEKGRITAELIILPIQFALSLGFWTLIVWIFRIRDSNPKIYSMRVAFKIIRIMFVTGFIVGIIIGIIEFLI